MSFWNKLFSGNETATKECADTKGTDKVLTSKKSDYLSSLIESVKTIGHHENPLFRKEYDLHSRMPSTDFSFWLIEKLRRKDYESIWAFVKEFYGEDENSGGGINVGEMVNEIAPTMLAKKYGMNINEAKREWAKVVKASELNDEPKNQKSWRRQLFDNFMRKDFSTYIEGNENLIYELQYFFILKGGMDDSMRGFWIGEDSESAILSKVISGYDFSIKPAGFETLISNANRFIKQMKKEEKKDGGDYWTPTPYFNIKDLKLSYSIETKTDLRSKLQSLGVGERLHFFDFASSHYFSKYWSGDSSYKTRSVGVNESESVKKMVEQNLFSYTNDIESVQDVVSKGELKEKAEINGFELKKSWNLQKINENLLKTDQGKIFLEEFVQEKRALKFNEIYKDDLHLVIDYQEQTKTVAQLISMI